VLRGGQVVADGTRDEIFSRQDLADLVAMRQNLAGLEFYPIYVLDLSTVHFVK
jgi:hypothetical protein